MKDNQEYLKSLFEATLALIRAWHTQPNKVRVIRNQFWTRPSGTIVGWSSYDGCACVLEMAGGGKYKVTGGDAEMMESAFEKSALYLANKDFLAKKSGSIGRLKAITRALE